MNTRIIRIRMSIHVDDLAPSTEGSLKQLKLPIERAVASALPDEYAVDTVKVTRINFAKPQEQE